MAGAIVVVVQRPGGGYVAKDHILQRPGGIGALIEPGQVVGVNLDVCAAGDGIAHAAHQVGRGGGRSGSDDQGSLHRAVVRAVGREGQGHLAAGKGVGGGKGQVVQGVISPARVIGVVVEPDVPEAVAVEGV